MRRLTGSRYQSEAEEVMETNRGLNHERPDKKSGMRGYEGSSTWTDFIRGRHRLSEISEQDVTEHKELQTRI